jgi:peptidoglycan/LPS O-acetylase OafA/YrhL
MLLGICTLTAAYFISTPQDNFYTCIFGFPLISLAYGLILAAIVCPSNILFSTKSWITSNIATLSYSIYLIHKIVIHLTQTLLEKAGISKDSNLMMLICILASITAALLMRYIIEKPALKLRDRVLRRQASSDSIPRRGRLYKSDEKLIYGEKNPL